MAPSRAPVVRASARLLSRSLSVPAGRQDPRKSERASLLVEHIFPPMMQPRITNYPVKNAPLLPSLDSTTTYVKAAGPGWPNLTTPRTHRRPASQPKEPRQIQGDAPKEPTCTRSIQLCPGYILEFFVVLSSVISDHGPSVQLTSGQIISQFDFWSLAAAFRRAWSTSLHTKKISKWRSASTHMTCARVICLRRRPRRAHQKRCRESVHMDVTYLPGQRNMTLPAVPVRWPRLSWGCRTTAKCQWLSAGGQ